MPSLRAASLAMRKPTLCRVRPYLGPGFPRPTRSRTEATSCPFRVPSTDQPPERERQPPPERRQRLRPQARIREPPSREDRKSTRLNSSHLVISYAVFCLKKKKP